MLKGNRFCKVRTAILALLGVLLLATMSTGVAQMTSNPNVDAVAVWQHRGEASTDWDIWYSIWDDQAQVWWTWFRGYATAPLAILEGEDHDPDIAFKDFIAMAVWSHQTGDPARQSDIYYHWLWTASGERNPMLLAAIEGEDTDPVVDFSVKGEALAAWVHTYEDGKRVIFYARHDGSAWGTAEPLVPLTDYPVAHAALPEITFIGESDQALVVWAEGNRIYYSLYDGASWSVPSPIPGQTADAAWDAQTPAYHRLGIASDTTGKAEAVWAGTGPGPLYHVRWDNGWSTPQQISEKDMMPDVDFNSRSEALSTYTMLALDIGYAQEQSGIWASAGFAAGTGGRDLRSALAFLHNDHAIVVWYSDAETGMPLEIWYSRYTGSWSPAAIVEPGGLRGEDRNPAIDAPPPWLDPQQVALMMLDNIIDLLDDPDYLDEISPWLSPERARQLRGCLFGVRDRKREHDEAQALRYLTGDIALVENYMAPGVRKTRMLYYLRTIEVLIRLPDDGGRALLILMDEERRRIVTYDPLLGFRDERIVHWRP